MRLFAKRNIKLIENSEVSYKKTIEVEKKIKSTLVILIVLHSVWVLNSHFPSRWPKTIGADNGASSYQCWTPENAHSAVDVDNEDSFWIKSQVWKFSYLRWGQFMN